MFDRLLKSKFYSRCKSELVKLMMKRIEIIRRKRNAVRKLRNDVAELLKTGLDSKAFDRVGELYTYQSLSPCYDFVEQSCLLVLSQLSVMNKQRECPEECKEPVSTLMFAAARFADLPELRKLRSLFSKRYGNNFEYAYVNQQFVKNLKTDLPATHIKIQMLQEIAYEYNINWDSKHLKHKLYKAHSFDLETNIKSRAEIETKNEEVGHGRLLPCWSSNTSISSERITSADDSASEDTYKKSTEKSAETYDGLLRSRGPPYTKQVPRSMRVRRPLERATGSCKGDNGVVKTSFDVSNGENNVRDEGEKKMDKLLSHYSTKGSHVPTPKRSGSLPWKGYSRAVTF